MNPSQPFRSNRIQHIRLPWIYLAVLVGHGIVWQRLADARHRPGRVG